MSSADVLGRTSYLLFRRGPSEYIRSDNGSEFTVHQMRNRQETVGVKTLFIETGTSWENGFIESFNGEMCDESPNRETFGTLLGAKVLIENWR